MRTEVSIFFSGTNVPDGPKAILDAASCGSDVVQLFEMPELYGVRSTDVSVTLDVVDPRLPSLLRLLKQRGIDYLENHNDRYTEDELDRAPLIFMDRRGERMISGVGSWKMTYDFKDACPVCGSGARQTSLMLVDYDDLPEIEGLRAAATYSTQILVDEQLAHTLMTSGATGLSFRNVSAYMKDRHRVKLPWRQLCADHVLPRMSSRSTGVELYKPCSTCHRSGYARKREDPFRPVYRAQDLVSAQDVNITWERFGEWRFDGKDDKPLFSHALFLVTPKVRRIIRAAEDRVFDWTVVRVEHPDGSIEGPPVPVPAV